MVTPLAAKNILKTWADFQACQIQQSAYKRALEDCQLAELQFTKKNEIEIFRRKALTKKLFWANFEKWSWRTAALALVITNAL